jgi:hypothetical protein
MIWEEKDAPAVVTFPDHGNLAREAGGGNVGVEAGVLVYVVL